MMKKTVTSRISPTAVSGAAAMLCLTGAWLAPSTTATNTNALPTAPASASATTVHLAAHTTPLHSTWAAAGGPGSGPGGGSDSSPGNAVAAAPTKHQSGGSSSSSASGSTSSHASSAESSGPIGTAFKTVGRWLGLTDRPTSGDSSKSTHLAGPSHSDRAATASDQDPTSAAPKQVKPGSTASSTSDKSSKAPSTSGIGNMLDTVFSGVSRMLSNLFGH